MDLVWISSEQVADLRELTGSRCVPADVALRARIVLWSAEGQRRIAELAGVTPVTVDRCTARYAERGRPDWMLPLTFDATEKRWWSVTLFVLIERHRQCFERIQVSIHNPRLVMWHVRVECSGVLSGLAVSPCGLRFEP
ncbi:helix-turn-helix domain-containing protein [Streptomyces colonosanans]|uniref:Uncharacterized protein n=1 Tax=Streptomyces colonosanans TaxID=1428652 RepID=A0A1S2PCD3_9ACTN|nr:helix-turn-helix domain-containing protein [Streptomyces colonosanans]OIJ91421.1 hypothetical protein BIV24_15910 [Streptomyces colonosanans]